VRIAGFGAATFFNLQLPGGHHRNAGSGVFYQSGGTLTASSWLGIGSADGNGVYNLDGGTVVLGEALNVTDWVGNTIGASGTFNISNGAITAREAWVGKGYGTKGVVVQTGGTVTLTGANGLHMPGGASFGSVNAAGTYQLLGGALLSTGTGLLVLNPNATFIVGTNGRLSGFGQFNQIGGVANISGTLSIDPSGTAAVTAYNFTGGTATIGGLTGTNGVVVVGSTAAASVASLGVGRFALGSLRIETSGVATVGGGGPHVSNSAGTLTINGDGTLDLADGSLVAGTAADSIKSYLARAYTANGDWSGPGLTSALARGNPVKYSVAYASGSDQSAQDAGIGVGAGRCW
jgi:hypothetical protein